MGDPSFSAPPSPLLRPLGFGEIFDRAITLYVRNFLPFVAIALVYVLPLAIVQYAIDAGQAQAFGDVLRSATDPAAAAAAVSPFGELNDATLIAIGASTLLLFFVQPFVAGATAIGIALLYDRRHVAFNECYERTLRRWRQILGMVGMSVLAVIGGYLVLLLAIIAVVLGELALTPRMGVAAGILVAVVAVVLSVAMLYGAVMLFMAFAFAFCAVVIERTGVFASLGAGFGRVFARAELLRAFGVAFCMWLIAAFGGTILGVPGLFALMAHAVWLAVALDALAYAAVTPFAIILIVVYYYDVRVRREGLDLEAKLHELLSAELPA